MSWFRSRRRRRPTASLVAGLLAAVATVAGCGGAPGQSEIAPADDGTGGVGDELRTPPILQEFAIGGDFALDDHTGQRFVLQEHRGEPFLMFFGYTSCPDFCPNTLARLAEALELLDPSTTVPTTLFVTVDPERDTPERLASYLALFGIAALGLTGTADEIAAVAEPYAAHFELADEDSAGGPLIAHTTYVYLIDAQGKVRYTFRHDDTARFIASGIQQLAELDARGPGI